MHEDGVNIFSSKKFSLEGKRFHEEEIEESFPSDGWRKKCSRKDINTLELKIAVSWVYVMYFWCIW